MYRPEKRLYFGGRLANRRYLLIAGLIRRRVVLYILPICLTANERTLFMVAEFPSRENVLFLFELDNEQIGNRPRSMSLIVRRLF